MNKYPYLERLWHRIFDVSCRKTRSDKTSGHIQKQ